MARSDFAFSFPFRIRYSEVDGQRVVFNAHYLTYFDTAITEFLRSRDIGYNDHFSPDTFDFHLVKATVEYKRPIRFDDEIDVCVRIGAAGRSSVTFAIEIHPRGEDALLSTGDIIWVYTDMTTGRSSPVPGWFLERMGWQPA
ncbi:putative 4-hydroxybenzoyl-CoA thioesterase [Tistrella bauzanensis]|uniref:4-hydroxybenzoyl-CoA thioesterase n=1 Tax=Tistrella bauzanensis TaxID=657419 RepID=A0ABQ1J005_9PROT|nr:thioesterase family protein [Tistrella bauzanensis]GGB55348.1 putative 4-hydroxybenzoyl-CoA thioesterase [Tistrella bauzanensis]